ncbi:hypothetical protein A4G26_24525 [Mycobacterium kansasii]|uniref:DUF2283 domain-containing protein n=1 Tax=Mycobacterium innocens TaxID=2341083 RepID=A0A498QJP1_9MYCO|nr:MULTISPECIES: DUF2283 domain-containing protein [Mycobacterium]KZS71893.1 hypothetical protein A4G29_05945 [Mycobacterium kansasii]KZS72164.1 hypothetical protein A4G26_24525 [Mycobacterium kansasii]VBA46540.1 hypothetical protein LAUMK13_05681 [Mycobacterium innocens]
MITLSVDTSVGAAYIQLTDKPVAETVEETPDIQVDFDAAGVVVGIEVLNLAADLPVESLSEKYRFANINDVLALSQVKPAIHASIYSAGPGRGFMQTIQTPIAV